MWSQGIETVHDYAIYLELLEMWDVGVEENNYQLSKKELYVSSSFEVNELSLINRFMMLLYQSF